MNNHQELFHNLKLIEEFKKTCSQWTNQKFKDIENVLSKIKLLDQKIENINNISCKIEDFIFEKNHLVNIEDIESILADPDIKVIDNSYMEKIRYFVDQYYVY